MKKGAVLTVIALLLCCGLTATVSSRVVPAAAQSAHARALGTWSVPFAAIVVQGPSHGQNYSGQLRLTEWKNGAVTGTIRLHNGRSVPVRGQLHGVLIGLRFNLGGGHNLFGTGLIGLDGTQKTAMVGGTFSGPDELSMGTWDFHRSAEVREPTNQYGGCTTGIAVDYGDGIGVRCTVIVG